MSQKPRKTTFSIREVLETSLGKELSAVYIKKIMDFASSPSATLGETFPTIGNLPEPLMSEITKKIMQNPEFSQFLKSKIKTPDFVADSSTTSAATASVPTATAATASTSQNREAAGQGKESAAFEKTDSPAKKQKKKKSKKTSSVGGNNPGTTTNPGLAPNANADIDRVLKPRNFLEGALYFSTISMSKFAMTMELEPECFFAPPLLFQTPEGVASWLESQRRCKKSSERTSRLAGESTYEQRKYMQRKTLSLFALALTQTPHHMKKTYNLGERLAHLSMRSNYMKRSIGMYAISLVDNLPPTLSKTMGEEKKSIQSLGVLSSSPLLANKTLEFNDLKVPTAAQLSEFWAGLPAHEKAVALETEQISLLKGWFGVKNPCYSCTYCRNCNIRFGGVFELLYRAYFDDVNEVLARIDSVKGGDESVKAIALSEETRERLYQNLAVLSDDIVQSRGNSIVKSLRRLARAFDVDLKAGQSNNYNQACGDCAHGHASLFPLSCSGTNKLPDTIDDDFSDGGGEEDEEEGEDEEVSGNEESETFYEEFNLVDDEDIGYNESELPVDVFQLPSCFPDLYGSQKYEGRESKDRLADLMFLASNRSELLREGKILYENLASLLLQFSIVPRYFEAQAVARQKRLIEEEEERERAEREREQQKFLAKQKKKERLRAAKEQKTTAGADPAPFAQAGESIDVLKEIPRVAESDKLEGTKDPELLSINPLDSKSTLVLDGGSNDSGLSKERQDVVPVYSVEGSDPGSADETPPGMHPKDMQSGDEPPGIPNDINSSVFDGPELTGEAPPGIAVTWFDKILQNSFFEPAVESLWSPVATQSRILRTTEDRPPGFAKEPLEKEGFEQSIWRPFRKSPF